MAVQVEQRKQLEGEVQAGVALIRGGASGSSDSHAAWQANLPSQSIVDNQWRLYLLCEAFEAQRLQRDAYCAASAGIWEQIVGSPIPVEGCENRAEGPVSGTDVSQAPAPRQSVEAVVPAAVVPAAVPMTPLGQPASSQPRVAAVPAPPPTVTADTLPPAAAPASPQATMASGGSSEHWVDAGAPQSGLELWGPLEGDGNDLVWVVFNGSCLSLLVGRGGQYEERMLLDRRSCTPWSAVALSHEQGGSISLLADGRTFTFSKRADTLTGEPAGIWNAEFYARLPPRVRPLVVEFVGQHAAVAWRSGCSASWVRKDGEGGHVQYKERVDQPLLCTPGASVDVQVLSTDTLLLEWNVAGIAVWGLARQ